MIDYLVVVENFIQEKGLLGLQNIFGVEDMEPKDVGEHGEGEAAGGREEFKCKE